MLVELRLLLLKRGPPLTGRARQMGSAGYRVPVRLRDALVRRLGRRCGCSGLRVGAGRASRSRYLDLPPTLQGAIAGGAADLVHIIVLLDEGVAALLLLVLLAFDRPAIAAHLRAGIVLHELLLIRAMRRSLRRGHCQMLACPVLLAIVLFSLVLGSCCELAARLVLQVDRGDVLLALARFLIAEVVLA